MWRLITKAQKLAVLIPSFKGLLFKFTGGWDDDEDES